MLKPFVPVLFFNRIQHVWYWHWHLNFWLLETFQMEPREEVRLSVKSISDMIFNGAWIDVYFCCFFVDVAFVFQTNAD